MCDRKWFTRLSTVIISVGFMILPAIGSGQSEVNNEASLDNGLIRLSFNQKTGLFDLHSPSTPSLQIYNAGPRLNLNGKTISPAEAIQLQVLRQGFEDTLGRGERLIITYSFEGEMPSLRYEIGLYNGRPWAYVRAFLPKGDYAVRDFDVIDGKLKVPGAFETRVYVNSGTVTTGGDTGVWEMGLRQWTSANISVFYEPRSEEAVGLGFYSFYRASSSVTSHYLGTSEIGIRATAHYHGYRPKQDELRTESVLVDCDRNPLRILEQWVDAGVKTTHPNFNHDVRTGTFNSWFVYGAATSEQDLLTQAKLLRESFFPHYGVTLASTGEWQIQDPEPGDAASLYGFGEDLVDPKLYPSGLKGLFDKLHSLGLQANFGANYAYASLRGTMARANAPWLIKEDLNRIQLGYPIDFTHPGAQSWLYDLAKRTKEYGAVGWWTDFDGGPTRGKLYDPTKIMGFEDIREGLRITREAVGPNVFIHKYCCGPYFTYLGLVDRVRVGDDAHALGDFEGLKAVARQLAGNYMLHQKFWINDPDPVFVGGRNYLHNPGTGPILDDHSFLNEVRMRLLNQLASGGLLTIGENLEDLNDERRHLLTLVLPTYGQAARPLDLFTDTTPEVYDLTVKTNWDQWHVVMLQNWNFYDKQYELAFSQLGLDENKRYALFRFWDQNFLGEFRSSFSLKVGAQTGEAIMVRELPAHPWVLSTDMNLTQGGVDLESVRYDPMKRMLEGTALRHPGAEGHLVIYCPEGYKIHSASGDYQEEHQTSGAKIVRLRLQFTAETLPWSITFTADAPDDLTRVKPD